MPTSASRRPAARTAPTRTGSRRFIVVCLVLIAGLAVFNLAGRGGGGGGPPLLGAEALAALPDGELEGALLGELGRATYGEGARPDAWRKLPTNARHLWAVAAIRGIDPQLGLEAWLEASRQGSTSPGPEDMRAGLEAMGLTGPQRVMESIIARRDDGAAGLDRLLAALRASLDEPATRAARLAWIRDHLAELAPR